MTYILLIIVKQAKLEVVYFFLLIKIYFVKDESVIRQRQVYSHLTKAQNELPKVQRAIKVLIKPPKCLCEAFILLQDTIVDVLEQLVNA